MTAVCNCSSSAVSVGERLHLIPRSRLQYSHHECTHAPHTTHTYVQSCCLTIVSALYPVLPARLCNWDNVTTPWTPAVVTPPPPSHPPRQPPEKDTCTHTKYINIDTKTHSFTVNLHFFYASHFPSPPSPTLKPRSLLT